MSETMTSSLAESTQVLQFGDAAVLVKFIGTDPDANWLRAHSVARIVESLHLESIRSQYPAYDTILIEYDPVMTAGELVIALVRRVLAGYGPADEVWHAEARTFALPVAFGGEVGPDFEPVASELSLDPAELIERLCSFDFVIRCTASSGGPLMGTAPGLGGLKRMPSPRTRVEGGSVMMAGDQFSVAATTSPSGWRVVGRTPARLVDRSGAGDPLAFLPGDRLHCYQVSAVQLDELADAPLREWTR